MNITVKTLLIVSFVSSNLAAGAAEDALNKLKSSGDNAAVKEQLLQEITKDSKALALALKEVPDRGNASVYRCDVADVLSRSGDAKASAKVAGLLTEGNRDLNICVAKYSGENRNEAAVDALSANVEDFLYNADKGLAEKDLKKKIGAINSIRALGERGTPKVMDKLQSYYNSADEVIRINIIFSMGKLKTQKVLPYPIKVAENENETDGIRSAADEMIEELEKGAK